MGTESQEVPQPSGEGKASEMYCFAMRFSSRFEFENQTQETLFVAVAVHGKLVTTIKKVVYDAAIQPGVKATPQGVEVQAGHVSMRTEKHVEAQGASLLFAGYVNPNVRSSFKMTEKADLCIFLARETTFDFVKLKQITPGSRYTFYPNRIPNNVKLETFHRVPMLPSGVSSGEPEKDSPRLDD